jgi:hypothetical protein
MKKRVGLLILVAGLLLLGTVALAQRGPQFTAEDGVATGGGYRLVGPSFDALDNAAWQVCGLATGGGYTLLAAAAPGGRGSGCCCTYLPLGLRSHP